MPSKSKTLAFSLVAIAMGFFMLEIASFAGLVILNRIRPNLFVHGYVDRHFDSITEEFQRRVCRGRLLRPCPGLGQCSLAGVSRPKHRGSALLRFLRRRWLASGKPLVGRLSAREPSASLE